MASTMSRSPKAWAARRSGSPSPSEFTGGVRQGASTDGGVPGPGRGRVHPGAGYQHRDGHRDRQRHRVRGDPASTEASADARLGAQTELYDAIAESGREDVMPKFRGQSDDAVHRARFPRPLRRAAEAGFEGVEYLFPYAFPKEELRRASAANGLTQVLHNLPAGDWGARRARHRLPAGPRRRVPGRGRQGDRLCEGAGCPQVNCLAGIAPAGRGSRRKLRATFVEQSRVRRRRARRGRASSC